MTDKPENFDVEPPAPPSINYLDLVPPPNLVAINDRPATGCNGFPGEDMPFSPWRRNSRPDAAVALAEGGQSTVAPRLDSPQDKDKPQGQELLQQYLRSKDPLGFLKERIDASIFNDTLVRQTAQILSDTNISSSDKEQLLSLLTSNEHREFVAGRQLVAIRLSDRPKDVNDKDTTVIQSMLKDPDQHSTALDILNRLEGPNQIHEVLGILDQAPQAAEEVRNLIKADGTADAIVALSRLLASPHTRDQGGKLLKKLDSGEKSEREDAVAVLKHVHDFSARRTLLELLDIGGPVKDGVKRALGFVASEDKAQHKVGLALMDMAGNPRDREHLVSMLDRLGGDEAKQRAAFLMLSRLSLDEQESMLHLARRYPKAHESLMQWLAGDKSHATAVTNVLPLVESALAANRDPREFAPRPRAGLERRGESSNDIRIDRVAARALEMLSDKQGQNDLFMMVSKLRDLSQVRTMIGVMQMPELYVERTKQPSELNPKSSGVKPRDDAKKDSEMESAISPESSDLKHSTPLERLKTATAQLHNLLESKDSQDINVLGSILNLVRGSVPARSNPDSDRSGSTTLPELALSLTDKLAAPKHEAAARLMLLSFHGEDAEFRENSISRSDLGRANRLHSQHPELSGKLHKMLSDPSKAALAHVLLRNLTGKDEFEQVFAKFEAMPKEAGELALQASYGNPRGVDTLVRMLAYEDKTAESTAIKKAGEEIFTALASTDSNYIWTARSLMQTPLPPAAMRLLHGLLSDSKYAEAGQMIKNALIAGRQGSDSNGPKQLLEALGKVTSTNSKEESQLAWKAIELLQNKTTRDDTFKLLLAVPILDQPAQFKRMSQALTNPREHIGAIELIKLLSSPDLRIQSNASAVVIALGETGKLAESRRAGRYYPAQPTISNVRAEELLHKLHSPSTRQQAKNIILNLRPDQQELYLNLTDPKNNQINQKAKDLLSGMLGSADYGKLLSIRNLMNLLTDQVFDKDPDKEQAAAQLTKWLGDPRHEGKALTILSRLESDRECLNLMRLLPKAPGAFDLLYERLRSESKKDQQAVRHILNSEPFKIFPITPSADRFTLQLERKETRDLAKKALPLIEGPRQVQLIAASIADKSSHEALERLISMAGSKQPMLRSMAKTMLNKLATPEQLGEMMKLIYQHPRAAHAVLSMLEGEGAPFAAARFLSMLANEQTRPGSEKLVEMLGNADQRKFAETFISSNLRTESLAALGTLLKQQKSNQVANTIAAILQDGSNGLNAERAISLLGSNIKQNEPLKQRFVNMYNDPVNKAHALEELKIWAQTKNVYPQYP